MRKTVLTLRPGIPMLTESDVVYGYAGRTMRPTQKVCIDPASITVTIHHEHHEHRKAISFARAELWRGYASLMATRDRLSTSMARMRAELECS